MGTSIKENLSKTLSDGTVITGEAFNEIQFSAMFQIFVKEHFNVTDGESLAMWIADSEEEQSTYFDSKEKAQQLATAGFAKIAGKEIPFLTQENIYKN